MIGGAVNPRFIPGPGFAGGRFLQPRSAVKLTGSATHLFTKPAVQKGVRGTTGTEKCTGISIASWLWDR